MQKFIEAQEAIYPQVLSELETGRKVSHWMWFIFPQIQGLGRSSTAQYYAIKDAEQARVYLRHPILGARLKECAEILLRLKGKTAIDIFGDIDAVKLRSSMTLFSVVAGQDSVFASILKKYFNAEPDALTLQILNEQQG